MNVDIFRQYIALKEKKQNLEAELKDVTDQMDYAQILIMDEFVDNGVDSMKVDGRLVFPKRQMYASAPQMTQEIKDGLRGENAQDLIAEVINGQRLSSFVREYMKEKAITEITQLPAWMQDGFRIFEKVSLGVR